MKQQQEQNVEEVVVTQWHICEKKTHAEMENGRNAATGAATRGWKQEGGAVLKATSGFDAGHAEAN